MKSMICSIHSKWSLLAALFPRLWFYEDTLWRSFPDLWQYMLELPCKDYITFFPYIVNVDGIRLNFKNSRTSWGWRRKTVKDPINIVAYGVSPKEFVSLLKQANLKWEQFLGSSYFLYGPPDKGWHASIAVKLDINKHACERHHLRLFELKTTHGEKVTLIAAHRDRPHHREEEAPFSWNETRDLVGRDITCFPSYLTEPISEPNWRNADGDGRILIIRAKK